MSIWKLVLMMSPLRVTLFMIFIILMLALILSVVVIAEVNIDTPILTDADLMYSNETVRINSNITVQGQGSLTMMNCTIVVGSKLSPCDSTINIEGNASLHISGTSVGSDDDRSRFQFRISSDGEVIIAGTWVEGGGGDSFENPAAMSIRDAAVTMSESSFLSSTVAVWVENCSSPLLDNVTFEGNSQTGLVLRSCSDADLRYCSFRGQLDGTALLLDGCDVVDLNHCSFVDNNHGVLPNTAIRSLTLLRCTFTRNRVAVTLVNYGIRPAPIVRGCEFLEDATSITGLSSMHGDHWASEHVTVEDCLFRFSRTGVRFCGVNWTISDNDFEHCQVAIKGDIGRELRIVGNRFKGCMAYGIVVDEALPDANLEVMGNTFSDSPGCAVSIFQNGAGGNVSGNTFRDCSGGGLRVIGAKELVVTSNDFISCAPGISTVSDLRLTDNHFESCNVGIRADGCTLNIQNSSFKALGLVLLAVNVDLELVSGAVTGSTTLELSASVLTLHNDFHLGPSMVLMDVGTRATSLGNPGTPLTSWMLNGSSGMDFLDSPLPKTVSFLDHDSWAKSWWPLEVEVVRMSDQSPVPDVPVRVYDYYLDEVVLATTGAGGETGRFHVPSQISTAHGTSSYDPHLIEVEYKGMNITRQVNVTGPTSITFEVDDMGPEIVVTSPQVDEVVNRGAFTVEGIINDTSPVVSLYLSVDGGPPLDLLPRHVWSARVEVGEGVHVIIIEAVDALGNKGRVEHPVKVDIYPPFLEVWNPVPGSVLGGTEVTLEGRTEPGARVSSGHFNATLDEDGHFCLTVPLSGPGQLTIRLLAEDDAEHESRLEIPVVVDWTPPVVTLDTEHQIVNTTRPTLTGTISEVPSELRIQGGTVPVAEEQRYSVEVELLEGGNRIPWSCIDLAGNENHGEFTVHVDTRVELVVTSPVDGAKLPMGWVIVTGRTDPGASVIESRSGAYATAADNGSFSLMVWSGDVGRNKLQVLAEDGAGNHRDEEITYEVLAEPVPSSEGLTTLVIILILIVASILLVLAMWWRGARGDGD